MCAGHVQQLGGESPLPDLMEVRASDNARATAVSTGARPDLIPGRPNEAAPCCRFVLAELCGLLTCLHEQFARICVVLKKDLEIRDLCTKRGRYGFNL